MLLDASYAPELVALSTGPLSVLYPESVFRQWPCSVAFTMLLKTLLRRSNPLAYAQMEGEGEAGTHPGQEPATEASLTPTVLGARCDEPKPPTLPDGI
ncbi:hypothetical protein AK812_SmicGene38211 [Symbiodinium microadriaticum]|uniref:Uncharacterized protein n=1 Tax=Symbiodinium microadriaticum TaxID=2951 RepID=A0A1Q9CEE5_SYMMI|nr:hypothetical protein AK812_SmicGene38211 [Symbiodinium microadriaticum]